jgi:hypothetical protein
MNIQDLSNDDIQEKIIGHWKLVSKSKTSNHDDYNEIEKYEGNQVQNLSIIRNHENKLWFSVVYVAGPIKVEDNCNIKFESSTVKAIANTEFTFLDNEIHKLNRYLVKDYKLYLYYNYSKCLIFEKQ